MKPTEREAEFLKRRKTLIREFTNEFYSIEEQLFGIRLGQTRDGERINESWGRLGDILDDIVLVDLE